MLDNAILLHPYSRVLAHHITIPEQWLPGTRVKTDALGFIESDIILRSSVNKKEICKNNYDQKAQKYCNQGRTK